MFRVIPVDDEFALLSSFDMQLERLGHEGEPLLSVSAVLEDPKKLIDYAATQVTFEPVHGPAGGYPGVRAPAPLDYVGKLVRRLSPSIERAFGLKQVKLARAECSFSIVTLPPEQLAPLQRIPHTDTDDPLQFAILHYLCGPEMGGTAFYRHKATRFEAITSERRSSYEAIRDRELASMRDDAGYITGDNGFFEQIGTTSAAVDKVVVYRSHLLHSGQIPPDLPLVADPRRGRLTANIFVSYRPL